MSPRTPLYNGAPLIAAEIEPAAVLITKWSLPLLICPPSSGSNTGGQEECALRAKVLKVVKSNDSVCWCWRAATVQPCAYSPLYEDAVWVVVSFYNVPNGYGWKWWHTWWRRSFHRAIMAVTCNLGRGREVSNGSERTERGRRRRRVRGWIKTIRDAGLRWQPWARVEEKQAEGWREAWWCKMSREEGLRWQVQPCSTRSVSPGGRWEMRMPVSQWRGVYLSNPAPHCLHWLPLTMFLSLFELFPFLFLLF